ncbi:MAG: hypothetical protein IKL82_03590 [Clostridia bacterium]|nr:hypothetical protein [Clostridia bacterium]
MKNYYDQNYIIASSQCDVNSKLRFDAVLGIFQDVTTEHSTKMGTGHDDLLRSSNAFWVLSKVRFNLKGEIKVSSSVNAKTWPLKPQLIRFLRETQITSSTGTVNGLAEWCILDASTMAIRKASSVCYPHDMEYLPASEYVSDFLRIKETVEPENFCYLYKTMLTDIDVNGHVNNLCYARLALNAFEPNEFYNYNFTGFELHFISQTYYDYEISVYKKEIDGGVYVEGTNNGKTVFKAIFKK